MPFYRRGPQNRTEKKRKEKKRKEKKPHINSYMLIFEKQNETKKRWKFIKPIKIIKSANPPLKL
jgi:hypothetical protein